MTRRGLTILEVLAATVLLALLAAAVLPVLRQPVPAVAPGTTNEMELATLADDLVERHLPDLLGQEPDDWVDRHNLAPELRIRLVVPEVTFSNRVLLVFRRGEAEAVRSVVRPPKEREDAP